MISSKTLFIIPARMASTRLPGKPLAKIRDKPMILHVYERVKAAQLGEVLIATDHEEIQETARQAGAKIVMTNKNHPSGSDRIWEAACLYDREQKFEYIVNVQGDLPLIERSMLKTLLNCLHQDSKKPCDIATLASLICEEYERNNTNIVKVIGTPLNQNTLKALYFSRAEAPWSDDENAPFYHHIGLYAYKREALKRFVAIAPSPLEKRERLEQLRALENEMTIHVGLVERAPHGVDTPEDLKRVIKMMKQQEI